MTFFITLIVYYREVVNQDKYMTHFLNYTNTALECSRCKPHRYVIAPSDHISHIPSMEYL
jgi:hypothetical protein